MKNRRVTRLILACVAVLSICGCINYEQETYLNPDLSGRIEIHFFPNPQPVITEILKKVDDKSKASFSLAEASSKATFKIKMDIKEENILEQFNQEAIKNKDFKKIEKDGTSHFYFMVEFDDIRKLFAGKKTVSITEDGGLVTYTEYFKSLKKEPKEGEGDKGSAEMFKGFSFKYTLHAPTDIISANTSIINKNTAVWELPLSSVTNDKDLKITATFKKNRR